MIANGVFSELLFSTLYIYAYIVYIYRDMYTLYQLLKRLNSLLTEYYRCPLL